MLYRLIKLVNLLDEAGIGQDGGPFSSHGIHGFLCGALAFDDELTEFSLADAEKFAVNRDVPAEYEFLQSLSR